MGEQFAESFALRVVNILLQEPALKHLFYPQLAERFPLGA